MSEKRIVFRTSVVRKSLLFSLLLVVSGAFLYDSLVAKANYLHAWDAIKEIEASSTSSATTNDAIQGRIGRMAARVEDPRSGFSVETYVWRRGLLFNNYEIHVVYAKNEADGKLFYYSAVAGKQPTSDNFPPQEKALMVNLNPGPLAIAGAGQRD